MGPPLPTVGFPLGLEGYRGPSFSAPGPDMAARLPMITTDGIAKSVEHFMTRFQPIMDDLVVDECRTLLHKHLQSAPPPVWVLSTGRCGTLALQRLLERSRFVQPYHRNLTSGIRCEHNNAFYSVLHGAVADSHLRDLAVTYLCRIALDLIRSSSKGRQFCMINHGHTTWAPVIATLFPSARMIHLERNFEDVFLSFFTKNDFLGQLEPLIVDEEKLNSAPIGNEWYQVPKLDLGTRLVWYIHTTHCFCAAMRSVLGPHTIIQIHSEDLFNADRAAYRALQDALTISDIDYEVFQRHYSRKHNQELKSLMYSAPPIQADLRRRAAQMYADLQENGVWTGDMSSEEEHIGRDEASSVGRSRSGEALGGEVQDRCRARLD